MYTSTPADVPDPPFRFFEGLAPRLIPHTATVEMPLLWHCSTNGKLRILVKAQPAPQAPGHCHQLGLVYGRETWLYPTNTLSDTVALSAASRHKLASTSRHHSLLTATDTTAFYLGHGKKIHCFSGKTFPTLEAVGRFFFFFFN